MRPCHILCLALAGFAAACEIQPSGTGSLLRRHPLEEQLRPPEGVEPREGIAAALLMDTSGSMEEEVTGEDGASTPKIVIARRAVVNLIRQFEDYARRHPDLPVAVGVFEFSARDRQPSCREVIPLGPPDAAAAGDAVQRMVPSGGIPIGDAII